MLRQDVYFDECVNSYLAIRLRHRGFIVTTARDARMAGKTDAEQLAYATRIDAMLVSYDSLDYRRLHRDRAAAHSGIVLISNVPLDWQEVRAAMLIDWAATFPDRRSHLFRWHDVQQQFIAGMRLPGYGAEDIRMALGQIPPAITRPEAP